MNNEDWSSVFDDREHEAKSNVANLTKGWLCISSQAAPKQGISRAKICHM